MPRVTLDKTAIAYRRTNDWILGELNRQKKTQEDLAKYIGLDQCGVSKRLRGQIGWGYREILNAVEYLGGDLLEILWR